MKRVGRAPFGLGIIRPEQGLRREAQHRGIERGRNLELNVATVALRQPEAEMRRAHRRTVTRCANSARERLDSGTAFRHGDVVVAEACDCVRIRRLEQRRDDAERDPIA